MKSPLVAYTFKADIYCPDCIIGAFNGNSDDYDSETILDILASGLGISRDDEFSFDGDEFPKRVYAEQFDAYSREVCGHCGSVIN